MSGLRLGSYRAGDRSEYLALYGLSRFAFVDPIPRQEDFGVVDFLCILTREDGRSIYPESAFFVQVKSNKNDVVFDKNAIRWISCHMDHPLFLCICDKSTGELIFYSLARIWFALFLRTNPNKITLKLDSDHPPEQIEMREQRNETEFDVYVGAPILQIDIAELEKNPSTAFNVLQAWIYMDSENIARRRLGRIAVRCFYKWDTNVVPKNDYMPRYYYGSGYKNAELAIAPMLTALGHNYIKNKDEKKLLALREFMKTLPRTIFDEHGQKIADGIIGIPEET